MKPLMMENLLLTLLTAVALGHLGTAQRPRDLWSMGLETSYDSYTNWASSVNGTGQFLIVYPRTSQQVASVVTWAHNIGRNVRVQGGRHSFSPITISEQDDPSQTVIIDMTRYLNRLRMGRTSNMKTVIAEAGASMEEFMTLAENNGYGIVMAPTVGSDVTIGGVFAIGGHGTAIQSLNEKLTSPGFTFGSVSNSIASLKAVVWDQDSRKYVIKTFTRSDPEISAFLVHMGRAVITEISILVGRNYNMRCLSRVDIPANELFAHPDKSSGLRTFESLLDSSGRIDAIWFPFTERPWVKILEVTDVKPVTSRVTYTPYNYQFPFTIDNPQTPGTVFGPQAYDSLVSGLTTHRAWDIWGPSKNTILNDNRTSVPVVYSGFVVLTSRDNVQLVIHDMAQFYTGLLHKYKARGIYPIEYIQFRVTGVDDPAELRIPGAVAADISPASPIKDRPEFKAAVWMNTMFTTGRPYSNAFMNEFEEWAYSRFDGGDARVRPEWAKYWGHTDNGVFDDTRFLREKIPVSFGVDNWNRAIRILDKYDPHRVVTSELLRGLMVEYQGEERRGRGRGLGKRVGGFGWGH